MEAHTTGLQSAQDRNLWKVSFATMMKSIVPCTALVPPSQGAQFIMIAGQVTCPGCKTTILVSTPLPQVLSCTHCGAQFRLAPPRRIEVPPAPIRPVVPAPLIHCAGQRRRSSTTRLTVAAGITAFILVAILALAVGTIVVGVRNAKT